MSVRSICVRAAIIAAIALAWLTPASAQFKTATMVLKKIAPDVYMLEHPFGSSNSAFVVTPDGVLVFDADIRTADQVFAAIRKTTDKKIKYVVISHPSGDHATGAWHFR